MEKLEDRNNRRSIRLDHFDYSNPGAYFITICVKDRKSMLGKVVNRQMVLNEYGRIAQRELLKSQEIRKEISIDEYIIMPNHIHVIVFIGNVDVGANGRSPGMETAEISQRANRRSPDNETAEITDRANGRSPLRMTPKSISSFISGFKSTTTGQINLLRKAQGNPFWQRNYYEHIIRDEAELNEIRQYIVFNPGQWDYDRENIARVDNAEYRKMWGKWL
jgi:putative transposase